MKFVYKLLNGLVVHPECLEPFRAERPKGSPHIGIESAVHADQETGELPPNSMFKEGRFTLCGHCKKPVIDALVETEPKATT